MARKGMVQPCLFTVGIVTVVSNAILMSILLTVTLQKIHTDLSGRISPSVKRILHGRGNDHTAEDINRLQNDLSAFYGADKPACHLESVVFYTSSADVVTLKWQRGSQTSFMTDKLVDDDGSVINKIGGYYFIYSQIVYQGNGTEDLAYGRLVHKVQKRKSTELHESPTTLLQNLQSTPTIRRGRHAYTTSSLGGTFYLEPNSKVSVASSVPQNIDTSHSRTSFGMFLV